MIISSEIGLLIIDKIKKALVLKPSLEFDDFIKKHEDIFILNLKLEEELTLEFLEYVFNIISSNIEEDPLVIYNIIKYGKTIVKKNIFTDVQSENANPIDILNLNKFKSFILFYTVELKNEKPIYLTNDNNITQYPSEKQTKVSFEYIFNETNKNYYYFVYSKKYREYNYLIRKIYFNVNQHNFINALAKMKIGRYYLDYNISDTLLNDKDYHKLLESYSSKFLEDYGPNYIYRNYILSDPILSIKFEDFPKIEKIKEDEKVYEPKLEVPEFPIVTAEFVQCEHELAFENIKLEDYFKQLNEYVLKYVMLEDGAPICNICNKYIDDLSIYEGELYKKDKKLVPIVYQTIYSFAPYDKYKLSKFFIINTISSFDTIYKTDTYILYNKIAKLFLDWLIDININKNMYEQKYKKEISAGLFFISLTTNLFDMTTITKELYFETKHLNLFLYLCNSFIFLLDPYHISNISDKLKIPLTKKSINNIIYEFLKKILIIKEETLPFIENIIEHQQEFMTLELQEIKKNFLKKLNIYKKIEYQKQDVFYIENSVEFENKRVYHSDGKISMYDKNLKLISFEIESIIKYEQYEIDYDKAKKIYDKIMSSVYANFVYRKSQINEIKYTTEHVIFYYENKKILVPIEYYNFFTPINVYPNKYYAFVYYGRSNQYNNNIDILKIIYNELFCELKIPYFYIETDDHEQFFIKLIGYMLKYINIEFDTYLDKINIIDKYLDKEKEYFVSIN